MRAEVPIDVLLDTIQPYPTFSEAIFNALLELETALESGEDRESAFLQAAARHGCDFTADEMQGVVTREIGIEAAEAQINASEAEFVREFDGDVDFSPNAATVVRVATASAPMRELESNARRTMVA